MTHRDLVREDFVGKTIIEAECDAVNVFRLQFADGTRLAVEVESVGPGIYGMVACDTCTGDPPNDARKEPTSGPPNTLVDEAALRSAVQMWMFTPLAQAASRDLYLRLISEAVQLTYGEVVLRYGKGDIGIQDARRKVKRWIFDKLMNDPTAVLQVHDETVVTTRGGVDSKA